jgi:phosphotransferase system HPr (HPr) family protein
MLVSSDSTTTTSAVLPAEVDLHARPAGRFVREASRFVSDIVVAIDDRRANAKSILEVLALGARGGSELDLSASGDDAAEAVTTLRELIPQLV